MDVGATWQGKKKSPPSVKNMVGCQKSFLSSSVSSQRFGWPHVTRNQRSQTPSSQGKLPRAVIKIKKLKKLKKHGRIWTKGNSNNGIDDGSRSCPPSVLSDSGGEGNHLD